MREMNLLTKSVGVGAILSFSLTSLPAIAAASTQTEMHQNTQHSVSNLITQANPSTSQQSSNTLNRVNVFFPKIPNNQQEIGYVEPVIRTTDRIDVAEFAIEQLIAGPTAQERGEGLVAPIDFQGESICGKNFTISISQELAKLQFCRTVPTAGIGDDARIINAIQKTLKQFSSVDSVVILNKDGNCFKDLSGKNQCLKSIEGVVWQPVPGTRGTEGMNNSNPQLWKVGLNTIARNGDAINFDINANGKYVRYSANCQTEVLSRIKIGDIEEGEIVDTFSVDEGFNSANRFQERVLDYACTRSEQ